MKEQEICPECGQWVWEISGRMVPHFLPGPLGPEWCEPPKQISKPLMFQESILQDILGGLLGAALDRLWSNWKDSGDTCCRVCCTKCWALYELAKTFKLDAVVQAADVAKGASWWVRDGNVWQVDRTFLASVWTGTSCHKIGEGT